MDILFQITKIGVYIRTLGGKDILPAAPNQSAWIKIKIQLFDTYYLSLTPADADENGKSI